MAELICGLLPGLLCTVAVVWDEQTEITDPKRGRKCSGFSGAI